MNASTRFLTNVFLTNIAYRYLQIPATIRQEQKIIHMTELHLKHLLLRNLRKSASIPEAVLSTYIHLIESMGNTTNFEQIKLDFKKLIMEPYLETCYNSNSSTSTCDISYVTPATVIGNVDNLLEELNIDANLNREIPIPFERKCLLAKQKYKNMRKWKKLTKDKSQESTDKDESFAIKLLSFNILAQNLMEAFPYLYRKHNPDAMGWEFRKNLIFQEILEAEANIVCIQEMQQEHLAEFLVPFKSRYGFLYKKRTNNKKDGLLLLYRLDQFELLRYSKVELYQSNIELLSRDNVGIIAKFALKDYPETKIVIATTHLLYNPRRNDVRLAQVQLLLAEIEKFAFVENTVTGPKYLPIILSGDFNLQPWTGVYKFITEGSFKYDGKGRNLEPANFNFLTNMLIPPRLRVTDSCQHFKELKERLMGKGSGRVTLEAKDQKPKSIQKKTQRHDRNDVDMYTTEPQTIELDGFEAKFASGTLTHPFKMQSVYQHMNENGELEATTNQDEWITVDYIFYSDVEPLERYTLPTIKQCEEFLYTIPNFVVGSDHLCIGATFKISKK